MDRIEGSAEQRNVHVWANPRVKDEVYRMKCKGKDEGSTKSSANRSGLGLHTSHFTLHTSHFALPSIAHAARFSSSSPAPVTPETSYSGLPSRSANCRSAASRRASL